MCRIAGYVGPVSDRKVSMILRGLIMAEERRNPHGTGVVVKNLRTATNHIMKKGIRGRDFLVRGHADFLWEERFNFAFIHVRYMTSGEQSDRCSHPFGFRIKGIWHFGMHNGVFDNDLCRRLSKNFGCSLADVDSETFFWALQELQNKGKNLKEAIAEVTEFISAEGEFAFAYMAPEAVYLWRSEARPLSIFDFRKANLGRWFASTKTMMEDALKISGIKAEEGVYYEIKPFKLYKLGHRTNPSWEVETVMDLPRKEKKRIYYNPSLSDREMKQDALFDEVYGESSPRSLPDDMADYIPDYTPDHDSDDGPDDNIDNNFDDNFELPVPAELTNDELEKEIRFTSQAVRDGYTFAEEYLSELLYEKEKRKLRQKIDSEKGIRGKIKEKIEGKGLFPVSSSVEVKTT